MSIVNHDRASLSVSLPLSLPTGKVRVKKRSQFSEYGIPVPCRSEPFGQDNYVEWQIGYDLLVAKSRPSDTALAAFTFKNYKGEQKYPYELAELVYFAHQLNYVTDDQIRTVFNEIKAVRPTDCLDQVSSMLIRRSHPVETTINGVTFFRMEVCYPLIVHPFDVYDICTEIMNREKQRGVGVQPMLYVCIPLCRLNYHEPHFGRVADKNECAIWDIHEKEGALALELLRIFGMLSERHNFDVRAILTSIFPGLGLS